MTPSAEKPPEPELDERDFLLLETMAFHGIPIGALLVDRDPFEECHNVPWHELDFPSCTRRLARLADLGYIAADDKRNARSRFDLWLTPAGGERWRSHFDVRFGRFIHEEHDLQDGLSHRRFWSSDETTLRRFRESLDQAPVSSMVCMSPISTITDAEETPWLRYPTAYEFVVTHDESLTAVAACIEAIHDSSIDGWRRPATLARRFQPVAWHAPIGALAGDALIAERLANDAIHEAEGERWHSGLVSRRSDDDPDFLGYELADDDGRAIWSMLDEVPQEIAQWLLRCRDIHVTNGVLPTFVEARRLQLLVHRRWPRTQPFVIHRLFRRASKVSWSSTAT